MRELWELVDINENKTGIMIERGTNTPIPQEMYHVAVDIWTKSKDGKILLYGTMKKTLNLWRI